MALGLLLLLAASGCGATRKTQLLSGLPPDPCADSAGKQEVRSLLAARNGEAGSDAAYRVAPGDLLVVTVYNYRPGGGDFSSDVRVDDRGYISLPMMEPVRAAGLTASQVHRAIVIGLRKAQVLNEPLVSVFLKDYQGQEVVVLGAVARPGMYHLSRGKRTLVDLLSMAGGLTKSAGNYVLLRPEPVIPDRLEESALAPSYAIHEAAVTDAVADPRAGTIPICLDTVTGDPNPTLLTLQVRGGDLLIVPNAGQAFIEGEVDKPGPYPLTRGMTLTQLITSAGGMTFPAAPSHVRLIRQGESGEWEINLSRARNADVPDVRLTRNDRVVVPGRPGRKVVYGVYRFVTAVVRFTVGGAATIF